MHRPVLLVAACLVLVACEFRFTQPTPAEAPPAAPSPSITITNTNTNTNTVPDRSDTGPSPTPAPSGGGGTGGTGALPLPAYGEGTTRTFADAHPNLVRHSCQITDGDGAWQFLDQLIALLNARDTGARWGYLCKDASCGKVAADIVAYKASETGIWIVDVLGNHCPGPNDSPTQVRWGVLPFETARPWIGVRP